MNYGLNKLSSHVWSVAGIILAAILWEVSVILGGEAAGVASPLKALAAIWKDWALFSPNVMASMTEAVLGLALALLVAFVTAAGLAISRRARAAFTPLVLAQQTIPMVIIAPLITRLVGDGLITTVLFTAWLCWFPAAISFTHGLLMVDPERLAVFEVAGATRWQTFRHLQLPGAAATIVAGARASAGFSLISAIVLEYGGNERGLGALIIKHVRGIAVLRPDDVFALIIICAGSGALITWLTQLLVRTALRRWLVGEA